MNPEAPATTMVLGSVGFEMDIELFGKERVWSVCCVKLHTRGDVTRRARCHAMAGEKNRLHLAMKAVHSTGHLPRAEASAQLISTHTWTRPSRPTRCRDPSSLPDSRTWRPSRNKSTRCTRSRSSLQDSGILCH